MGVRPMEALNSAKPGRARPRETRRVKTVQTEPIVYLEPVRAPNVPPDTPARRLEFNPNARLGLSLPLELQHARHALLALTQHPRVHRHASLAPLATPVR